MLPLEMFAPSHQGQEGRWCRECFRKNARNERVAVSHPPRPCSVCGEIYTPKQIKTKSLGACSPKCKQKALRRRRLELGTELGRHRSGNLARYSLTVETYDAMLAAQGGVCAICRKPCTLYENLSVDHDHTCCPKGSCGKCLRGLLCNNCNRFIGLAGDDPEVLIVAAEYILRHRRS